MSALADFIAIVTGIMTILGIGGILTWRKITSKSPHNSYSSQTSSYGKPSKSKDAFTKSWKLFAISFGGVLLSSSMAIGLNMQESSFLIFMFFVSLVIIGGASAFFLLKGIYYWVFS